MIIMLKSFIEFVKGLFIDENGDTNVVGDILISVSFATLSALVGTTFGAGPLTAILVSLSTLISIVYASKAACKIGTTLLCVSPFIMIALLCILL